MKERQPGKLKATSKMARELVREFENATRRDNWGGREFAPFRREYLRRKSALLKFIAQLEAIAKATGK